MKCANVFIYIIQIIVLSIYIEVHRTTSHKRLNEVPYVSRKVLLDFINKLVLIAHIK